MSEDSPPRTDALRKSVSSEIGSDLHTSIALVHDAKGGSNQALSDLLARYQSRLERIVCVRLGARLQRHIDSVDIVQETFAVAFQKMKEFEPRSHASILGWLARIAENQIRDANKYLFAGKRDRGRELHVDSLGSPAAPTGFTLVAEQTAVFDRAARSEIREIMDLAMTRLEDDHREVILLRDYSDADWDYVEKAMGRSKHACQELHRRAWIRLRAAVKGVLDGG